MMGLEPHEIPRSQDLEDQFKALEAARDGSPMIMVIPVAMLIQILKRVEELEAVEAWQAKKLQAVSDVEKQLLDRFLTNTYPGNVYWSKAAQAVKAALETGGSQP